MAQDEHPSLAAPRSWAALSRGWRWGFALLLVLGVVVRLPGLGEPPLEFAAVRQLHSAGLARAYLLADAPPEEHPPGRVLAAEANKEPEIEPPLMEGLAVLGYRALGEERLWWPRVLSVTWWIAGAVVMVLLSLRLAGRYAAVLALSVYLFLPFAVLASRSFQPDPLMTVLIMSTALAATVHVDAGRTRPAWEAIALGAAAILVKLVAIFFVVPLMVVLAIARGGRGAEVARRAAAMGAAVLIPALAYHVFGTYVSGFLSGQEGGRIEPDLLITTSFWEGWAKRIADLLPLPRPVALLVAIVLAVALGIAARRTERWPRLLLGALLVGYVAFGLLFTVHYSTHDYYHLPLVPIAGLGVGICWQQVAEHLERRGGTTPPVLATGLLVVVLGLGLVSSRADLRPSSDDVRLRVDGSAAIGELVGHSLDLGYLAEDFGLPLTYYGDVSGTLWEPTADETVTETFDRLLSARSPDYFVVTDARLLDDDLAELLEEYPVLGRGDGWVVYDVREPRP